ncbi:uncharacterized protein snapc2 [Lampris incognitus]|uniref:uncharacterized protein snapc2 n=1 Tax=Lampris incognitus TaxID=2546036 RepID=UPI0024B4B276|nr:uncharacterized protein snapc2 [Lampris incognitus]
MKPPPRARSKPDRYGHRKCEENGWRRRAGKLVCSWKRSEQRNLLAALKRLRKTCKGDVDYGFLKNAVATRSISEIRLLVEALQKKLFNSVTQQVVRQRRQERQAKKSIEVWVDMASAVAGALEEPMSAAFFQMLLVSSTEPRNLSNSDPPNVHTTNHLKPADACVPPYKAVPHPGVPGQPLSITTINPASPHLIFKTPSPTLGPSRKLPTTSKVVRVPTATASPLQHQRFALIPTATVSTSQPVALSHQTGATDVVKDGTSSTPISLSTTKSSEPAKVVKLLTCASPQPQPKTQTTTLTSLPQRIHTNPPSTSSATILSSSHSRSAAAVVVNTKATIQYKKEDSLGMGVKGTVDFEKIYRYLSTIEKDNKECILSPMESAVVLDMVMSLPEELLMLDCKTLQRHMIKMYTCLSAPADSKMSREMFAEPGPETEGCGEDGQVAQSSEKDLLGTSQGMGGVAVPSKDPERNTMTRGSAALEEAASSPCGREAERYAASKGVAAEESPGRATVPGSTTAQRNEGQTEMQPAESKHSSCLTGNWDKAAFCPLNPFMVPLRLLTRKQREVEESHILQ